MPCFYGDRAVGFLVLPQGRCLFELVKELPWLWSQVEEGQGAKGSPLLPQK